MTDRTDRPPGPGRVGLRRIVAPFAAACLLVMSGCNVYQMAYVPRQVVASPGPPGFQSLEEWGVVPSIGGEVVTSSDEESLRETTGFTMSFSMPCSSYGYKGYGNDEIEVHVTAVTLDVLGAGGGPFHFGGEPFVVRPCGGHIVGRVTLPSTIEQVRLSFTLTLIERPGGRRIVEQSFVATMHRELEGRLEL